MHSHPSFSKLAFHRKQRNTSKTPRNLESTRPFGISKLNKLGKLFGSRKHANPDSLFRSIHEREPTPHRPRSLNLLSSSNSLSKDEAPRETLASRHSQFDQPPNARSIWFRTSPQPLDVRVRCPPADMVFSPSRSEPQNLRSLTAAAHESMDQIPPPWHFPHSPSAFCLRYNSDRNITDELGRSLGKLAIRNPDCQDERRDDCELPPSSEAEAEDMSCDYPTDALVEVRRQLGMSCDEAAISTVHSGSSGLATRDTSSMKLSDLTMNCESIVSCSPAAVSTVWTESVPDAPAAVSTVWAESVPDGGTTAQLKSRFSESPEDSPMAISPPRITITSTNASSEKPYQPPPTVSPVHAAAPPQRRHLGELTNQHPSALETRKPGASSKNNTHHTNTKAKPRDRAPPHKKNNSADDPFAPTLASAKSLPSVKLALASPPPVPVLGAHHRHGAYVATRHPHAHVLLRSPETPTPSAFFAGHQRTSTPSRKRAVSDSRPAARVNLKREGGNVKAAALLARPFVLPPFLALPLSGGV